MFLRVRAGVCCSTTAKVSIEKTPLTFVTKPATLHNFFKCSCAGRWFRSRGDKTSVHPSR